MNEVFQSPLDAVKQFVETAEKFSGVREGTPQHSIILAVYNANKPSGEYKMGKTDPWCCAFVGAVAAVAGVVESVPLSAHCDRFIKAILAKGGYEVDIPQLGDLAIFNWNGDGESDHIGIVCRVPENGKVTTIEGNNNDAVSYRTFTNAPVRFFRPAWSNCVGKPVDHMIDITQDDVVTWDKYRDFYKELPYVWANEVKHFPLLFGGCAGPYVKILQKYLGIEEDGHFGTDTEIAVKLYQKRRQLEVDGKVGRQTWASFFV